MRCLAAVREVLSSIPTLDDIRAAAQVIEGQVVKTPFLRSRTLSAITGAEIWIKFENLQFTASFKDRGALNKIASLSAAERASAASSPCRPAITRKALPIMPSAWNPGDDRDAGVDAVHQSSADERLRRGGDPQGQGRLPRRPDRPQIEAERSLIFVHPYDDAKIIAGQGTIGLEIAESGAGLDAVIVPVGGGGLVCGDRHCDEGTKPEVEIDRRRGGAVSGDAGNAARRGGASRRRHDRGGHRGLATMGDLTMAICRKLDLDIVLVAEARSSAPSISILTIEKTVAEGAGAASLAALLAEPERFKGKRVALILAGGNIDPRLLPPSLCAS